MDVTAPNAGPVLDNELVNGTTAGKNKDIYWMEVQSFYMASSSFTAIRTQIALVDSAVS
jgi:ABC-type enterochelin transport system substrate-binding protein